MDITILDNGDVSVKLMGGGLAANLQALYPDKAYDEIQDLTRRVWADNDSLYSPDSYQVGTKIIVKHSEVPLEHTPDIG